MSGLFSSLGTAVGSLFSGPQASANMSAIGGGLSNLSSLAGNITGIAGEQAGYGNEVLPTALGQYQAGATGQLTPAQQAMASSALTQSNLATTGTYSDLGLGDSTMESQDVAANQLQNMAEQGNLEAQSEQLGLQGLQTGENFLTGAVGSYGTAGQLTQSQIADILTALNPSGSTAAPTSTGTGTTAGTGIGALGTASNPIPNLTSSASAADVSSLADQAAAGNATAGLSGLFYAA